MTITQTTYGPDGVTLLSTIADNGDGTGTRTSYDADGNVTSVEQLTGLPIPEPEPLPADPLLDAVDPRDTTRIRRT